MPTPFQPTGPRQPRRPAPLPPRDDLDLGLDLECEDVVTSLRRVCSDTAAPRDRATLSWLLPAFIE